MPLIPDTFRNDNEDYITIPAIKRFMKSQNNAKFKMTLNREELMDSIIRYGMESEEKSEKVKEWVDEVVKEGIRDVYLQYAQLSHDIGILFSTEKGMEAYLNQFLDKRMKKHICENTYTEKYSLINVYPLETPIGRKIEFIYCKKLFTHDLKKSITKIIDYPVIAEYYLDSNWLLVRAKPRANLYQFNPAGFDIETAISTTTDKEIKEVIELVRNIIGFEKNNGSIISRQLKRRVFELLHKYTKTPIEISRIIDNKSSEINNIASKIMNVCSIPVSMTKDVEDDVKNIIEKYLSITWPDKQIFIKDRRAFPVKLSATDEEESKVEQIAALEEPLQTKALFFDNKKMLYKNESCDGVVFRWKRIESTYFLRNSFLVRIYINNKGICIFKFMEYTTKEDIDNVIYSIIGIK